jgi:anti-sigma B factor antagonist
MPLSLTHEEHGRYAVVAIDGELDLATAPALADLTERLIDGGATNLILDAEKLSFCDSSGLGVLVRIANRLEPVAGRLLVARVQPIVLRVLEVTGLVGTVGLADSVAAAKSTLDIDA